LYFLPSQGIQYRLRGVARFFNDQPLPEQWLCKAKASRLADVYHSIVRPQSSVVPDRQTLRQEAAEFERQAIALEKPIDVMSVILAPTYVEQWVGSPADRLHDRRRYQLSNNVWQVETLVP
jgi:pyridoxine/pyridoxamine 5'-phosphate oxidase